MVIFCGEEGGHGSQQVPAVEMTDGFADRVHGQLGYADIDRGDACFGRGQGADGGTAGQVVAHDELLAGNLRLGTEPAEQGGGKGIGGVALVGVGFDDRSPIEPGQVVRIMLAGKVGVDRVRSEERRVGKHCIYRWSPYD